MKLRHAIALALVGWYLTIPEVGKTTPKDCPECAVQLNATAFFSRKEYRTKEECEKAGQDWIREFYADARKNGERVAFPPSNPECVEAKAK
jgi:hypothetical protein